MTPTEIIPVTELTDTELDAVSGGSTIIASAINQQNFSTQNANAVNVLTLASLANVTQTAVQSNSIS
jgi:bacteriocin-like protein